MGLRESIAVEKLNHVEGETRDRILQQGGIADFDVYRMLEFIRMNQ
jgi:hypothetical protein